MKKVLFDVDVLDKHYCIYQDEETNNLFAYAIKKNEKEGYAVKKEGEIDFLNKIVESLNKKYIKREVIDYNNEYYYRYINKYSQKSYFSKIVAGNEEPCSYESIKKLYDYYNSPKVLISKSKKVTKIDSNDWNYFDYTENFMNNRKNQSKSKLPMKIVVSILGVAAAVTVGLGGYQLLSKTMLPNVSISKEEIGIEKIGGLLGKNTNIENSQVEGYKIADEAISEKYKTIQSQLEEIGLENWEIAVELDAASAFNFEMDDISFYYDGDKDEIIYVDGIIEKGKEDSDNDEIDRDSIPENVQQILTALRSNEKLSYEEKTYIEERFLPDWIQNSEYLQTEQLADSYANLKINYDYNPEGKEKDNLSYIPKGTRAAGEAFIGLDKINIYVTDHFEPGNTTIDHEVKHFNGRFNMYESTLLNEGYTSLDVDSSYATEQLMVGLLMETFGRELINEGYYSSNLKSLVANNIVETTGKTIEEATKETYDFFDDIQNVLYRTEELGDNYREDAELMQDYEDIFNKIAIYYEANNKKEMSKNAIVLIIKDEIMGTNDTQMLESKETVDVSRYSGDGTLEVKISKNEGDIEYYQEGVGTIKTVDRTYLRTLTIKQDDKYNSLQSIFGRVKDEDIDYVTR